MNVWSVCAYVQANLGLRCPQIALGPFSCIENHMIVPLLCKQNIFYKINWTR